MKRTFIYAIAGAIGVMGVAETAPQAFAAEGKAPRSLEQLRADVRGEAMTSLAKGDVQNVGWRERRYYGRRHYGGRRYWGPRRYYGRRYYAPRRYYGYRPYYAPRRYYGYRRYYGPRRYYRPYRPGIYFGIY